MSYRELSIKEKVWSRRILIQCLVLGTVLGPLLWAIRGGDLWWAVCAAALAPIVVETLRPTYVQE